MKNEENQNLKPVIFVKGDYNSYYYQNTHKQNLLLKAITISDDPKAWKVAIGARTMEEVSRTLDKLVLRQEYHQALAERGVDFASIIDTMEDVRHNASYAVRLKTCQTYLRSLGLEKYQKEAEAGQSWEELLVNAQSRGELVEPKVDKYEVIEPPPPSEEVIKRRAIDREMGKDLYAE